MWLGEGRPGILVGASVATGVGVGIVVAVAPGVAVGIVVTVAPGVAVGIVVTVAPGVAVGIGVTVALGVTVGSRVTVATGVGGEIGAGSGGMVAVAPSPHADQISTNIANIPKISKCLRTILFLSRWNKSTR